MKDCITLNTWKTIDSRRKVKKKAQVAKPQCSKKQLQITAYSELDRENKKRARADKKEFKEKLADEAEEATQYSRGYSHVVQDNVFHRLMKLTMQPCPKIKKSAKHQLHKC